jgi:hypothetical protein
MDADDTAGWRRRLQLPGRRAQPTPTPPRGLEGFPLYGYGMLASGGHGGTWVGMYADLAPEADCPSTITGQRNVIETEAKVLSSIRERATSHVD